MIFFGCGWAGLIVIFTLPVVHLFIWSLKLKLDPIWLGACYGGMVGFIAILPLTLAISSELFSSNDWAVLLGFAVGPGITVPLGQLGGAGGGRRAWQRAAENVDRYRRMVAIGWQTKVNQRALEAASANGDPSPSHFQFRIAHLMWLVVWISLLLTIIRLSGVPYELIWPVLLGGLAYQAFTLWLGQFIVPPIVVWWTARRQSRST